MSEIILKIRKKKSKVQLIQAQQILQQEMDKRATELQNEFESVTVADSETQHEIETERIVDEELEQMGALSDIDKKIEDEPEELKNIHNSEEAAHDLANNEDVLPKIQARNRTIYTEIYTIADNDKPIEIEIDRAKNNSIDMEIARQQIQDAYDKGFADCTEMASINAEAKIQEAYKWVRRIDQLMFELREHYSDAIDGFKNKLLDVAAVISEAIIDKEVKLDNNIILQQVKRAIEELDDDVIFKIHANPADIECLKTAQSSLTKNDAMFANTMLISDANVKQGGCILYTSAGTIDARINSQLEIIKQNITEFDREKRAEHSNSDYNDFDIIPDVSTPLTEYEEYISQQKAEDTSEL